MVWGKEATFGLPTRCYKGILVSPKIMILTAATLAQTLKLANFSAFFHSMSIVKRKYKKVNSV